MALFVHERRVRYVDTDQFSAAHHSRVFLWFEEARTDYLRELGRPYSELEAAGVFFPVREGGARYRALARFDALLKIAIDSVDLRGASLRFEYSVVDESQRIAEGFTVHACVDRAGAVRRIPSDVRVLFERPG